MQHFLSIAGSLPTLVFSAPLALLMLYWLVALLGLVDPELFLGDTLDLGDFSALSMKFGLDGVPFTVLATGVALFGWLLAYFADYLWLQPLDPGRWRTLAAVAVVLGAGLLAVPLTGLALFPLRRLFARLQPVDSASLLGRVAIVRSAQVTAQHGQASLDDGGAGLILQVRSAPAGFVRGDRVVLVDYSERDNSYRVIADRAVGSPVPPS